MTAGRLGRYEAGVEELGDPLRRAAGERPPERGAVVPDF